MMPIGEYPYNTIEITDIEFVDIDNDHYKKGWNICTDLEVC